MRPKAFAANGDRVHICDIDEGALKQVTDENEAITATVCDVSDSSSVERFVNVDRMTPDANQPMAIACAAGLPSFAKLGCYAENRTRRVPYPEGQTTLT